MTKTKKFEVSWFEDGKDGKDLKVLGPYTFTQVVNWAQKLMKVPGAVRIRILEVTE